MDLGRSAGFWWSIYRSRVRKGCHDDDGNGDDEESNDDDDDGR